ncbi:hypothetical protein OAE92_00580 [Akkermansiaceae bacterium]|nr:hypothetical protein [Akkermansiaceae bacterium]
MKRRRGRRSFWWWSWLLFLTALGGTLGGAFYGKQEWEKADKEYPASAIVKTAIRAPFKGNNLKESPTGITNVNESQVIKEIESHAALSKIVADLNLTQKWALGLDDVIATLRSSLDVNLDQQDKMMEVAIVRPDPNEAAEIATAIAKLIPDVIKALDASNKSAGLERLKLEAEPYNQTEGDARQALKQALLNIKVNLEPTPGMDLNIYMTVPAVAEAKEYWDTVRETKIAFDISQGEYSRYWQKPLKPSFVSSPAMPAPNFTGPEMKPFQVQFGLYGLTLGLFGGIVLMTICWKLFP